MIDELNDGGSPIILNLNYDEEKIKFLDVEICRLIGKIGFTLYKEPSDRNTLLYSTSCNPPALKNSSPVSQFLRVLRNNLDDVKRDLQIETMRKVFLERGYHKQTLKKTLERAYEIFLKGSTRTKNTQITIPMTFHSASGNIIKCIKKRWAKLSTEKKH
ncbi:Hypothetical predicted protein [Pelobates cultripes]|uniref:Helix-turn-helix domain-containing protein n=1 Tax=Pelobates cultripes TaxID=61616 RepID=A0AAD1S2A1_PELCU|nr:Hypothetical predicted protein [Pelobates cultripes]